jgi:large subunit ribosomal protein L25
MEVLTVTGTKRDTVGKEGARKIRQRGLIPGVIYNSSTTSIPVTVDPKQIIKILRSSTGGNTIFQFSLEGERQTERRVIIRDLQYHPIKETLLHVDLYEISLDEEITVKVPIELVGEAKGVANGGVLNHLLWELEIECLPTRIPPKIEVDVSALDIGDIITVADLPIPEQVKVLQDPEDPVVSVTFVTVKEEAEEEAAEVTEPEVIGRKREEEAEEEEEE